MENILLTVKFAEFLAIELSVLVVIGAIVVAGVYQIVQDKVNESRYHDRIAPKAA